MTAYHTRRTYHLGCILNASQSGIAILNEHHDTLGADPYSIVCDDSQNPDRSNKTVHELLSESYRSEGPTHESEFENSRPITEDCGQKTRLRSSIRGLAFSIQFTGKVLRDRFLDLVVIHEFGKAS